MFCIALADEKSGSAAVKHCSDSFSVDLGLDPEVVSAWHYLTDAAYRNGIIYTW